MIVVLDATVLIFLFEKQANAPIDPKTGVALSGCYERVNHLVATLGGESAKIIIPTPALAEILVRAGAAAPEWLKILDTSRHIRVVPFDVRAAVEFAAQQQDRAAHGRKADGGRAKAKFDDQIVAIASVEGADVIYSDDKGLASGAAPSIAVLGVADLPLLRRMPSSRSISEAGKHRQRKPASRTKKSRTTVKTAAGHDPMWWRAIASSAAPLHTSPHVSFFRTPHCIPSQKC